MYAIFVEEANYSGVISQETGICEIAFFILSALLSFVFEKYV